MWQRRQNKQPPIGYPTHFTQLDQEQSYDYGYDERYLETIPEVDSISSRRQSTHVGLPELPFRAVPPMTDMPQGVRVDRHASPTTSSTSHRDHGLRIEVPAQPQVDTQGVSPLTPRNSQERKQQHQEEEQPVSPIDPGGPPHARAPLPERDFQSQIPRKVSNSHDEGKPRTKWDEYSGEPTHDDRGKEASVQPGSQPVERQYPHLKERTKQILAGLRDRDDARKAPWGRQPPPVAPDPLDQPPQREPWRGASGRSAIVEPVKNTPLARKGPLQIPQRNVSRMKREDSVKSQTPQDASVSARKPLREKASEEGIKPVVPLKTRNLTPPLISRSPSDSPTRRSSIDSPEPRLLEPAEIVENPRARVESPQYDPEPTTPTTPTAASDPHVEEFAEAPRSFVPPEINREQSRFSWTTYTTSAVESPRSMAQVIRDPSSPPTMPDSPASNATIKKRPVSSSPFVHSPPYMHQSYADSTGSVVRKPLASQTSLVNPAALIASTSKSLPPTPTIVEAVDKIENLDAQLGSLQRRKHNITRIVSDLEASLRKNAVNYDMWKRREVEKNIANHKMELDDVGREIHELGLQLHRAQRKRDREDGFEAHTGLWIKRVTS